MSQTEDDSQDPWSEQAIQRAFIDRYPGLFDDVRITRGPFRLFTELEKRPWLFALTVEFAGSDQEGWPILVDATDALIGMLIEANWNHRELPQGEGVVFGGKEVHVSIEKRRPDLDRIADELLGETGK